MKNSNLRAFAFVVVLFSIWCFTSCDSSSSNYVQLRKSLDSFQAAAAMTVNAMVTVQERLIALAASEELNDEELDAAIAQFDEAVDELAQASQAMVESETDIQNALRDLQGSTDGLGVVQQALKARDVANVLTGGLTGLAEKMDSNRKAINAAYDELYAAYEEADMDGIDAAKAKIKTLGNDTLFSWLKKTTTTLVSAPVGAVVEGVKKGAVMLKFAAKTAVAKVWAKGCDVIAGPAECAEGIDAQGCSVSFNRTDEEGRAEVPAGNVTLFVSGQDLARVRLDEIQITEDEEKEIVLPETPIAKADDKKLANGEIPQPEEEDDPSSSSSEEAWILCQGLGSDSKKHYACARYNGQLDDLDSLDASQKDALCWEADYGGHYSTYGSESACRKQCRSLAEIQGNLVCDTMP